MDKKPPKAIILLVVVLIVGVIGFGMFVIVSNLNSSKATLGDDDLYVDPGSGQVVSDPEGKTPENYNANPAEPILLGIPELINYGISQYQIEALKHILTTYSQEEKKLNEFSITVDSIQSTLADRSDPNSRDYLTFEGVINRDTKYWAKLEYFDISVVKLYLYENDKTTSMYTSTEVDGATLEVPRSDSQYGER